MRIVGAQKITTRRVLLPTRLAAKNRMKKHRVTIKNSGEARCLHGMKDRMSIPTEPLEVRGICQAYSTHGPSEAIRKAENPLRATR